MEKKDIIGDLHSLVSHNVIGDKQLFSRYKGFRSELQCEAFIKSKYPKYKHLKGGVIISKEVGSESSLDNSIYFTTISKNETLESYLKIYESLKSIFEEMFIITYNEDNWESSPVMVYKDKTVNLPVPKFEIFEFNKELNEFELRGDEIEILTDLLTSKSVRSRNRYPIKEDTLDWLQTELVQFDLEDLISIYCSRLIFDGFIGFLKNKGKSSDIDLILEKNGGTYKHIEIKEKDLPKKNKKGFGLDIPRIIDLHRIQKESNIEYIIIVKHINNQSERKLVNWKSIALSDFIEDVRDEEEVKGGTGMRSSNSYNPTLICDFDLFNDL